MNTFEDLKISVAGTGYVGLSMAHCYRRTRYASYRLQGGIKHRP